MSNMDWVDEQEAKNEEAKSKEYFNIAEGANKFIMLSHCAPLAQVWDNAAKKYRPAEEGDTNVSIKGLCWVLQDDVIKSAKLPYKVVKQIRAIQQDPEWEFKLPFPHTLTLNAKNAGSKEVEYTLNASPKAVEIPETVLKELSEKPALESIVEKIKEKAAGGTTPAPATNNYPTSDIKPEDIPF